MIWPDDTPEPPAEEAATAEGTVLMEVAETSPEAAASIGTADAGLSAVTQESLPSTEVIAT